MKIKRNLSILVSSVMILGNVSFGYAVETNNSQAYTQTTEYQSILNEREQILNSIDNSISTLSLVSVNHMGIKDINPYNNPASDNWLTREVASQVGKSNVSQLTQEDFNKVKVIYLINNNIQEIPKEIGNLYYLSVLCLSANQIQELPAEIGNLSELVSLDVSQNQIKKINCSFANLSKLQSLVLSSNNIDRFPVGMENLNQLKTLTFSFNKLGTIPASIYSLGSLQQLYLENQRVELPIKYIAKNATFSISNPIKISTDFADISNISNGGTYSNNTITWLASEEAREESFSFSKQIFVGSANALFSGIAILPTGLEVPLGLAFSDNSVNNYVYTDEMLNVKIVLNGTGDYYALDTQIEYDTDLLELKGYSIKEGLKDYYVSNEGNTLRYIIASQGKQNPISSSVSDIIYLSFAPKQVGVANITIKQGQAANLEHETTINNLETMTVTVESPIAPPTDVNRDGKFTLIDLAIDGYYYGMNTIDTDSTKYDADIIPDGRIDDRDLQEIVKYILEEEAIK